MVIQSDDSENLEQFSVQRSYDLNNPIVPGTVIHPVEFSSLSASPSTSQLISNSTNNVSVDNRPSNEELGTKAGILFGIAAAMGAIVYFCMRHINKVNRRMRSIRPTAAPVNSEVESDNDAQLGDEDNNVSVVVGEDARLISQDSTAAVANSDNKQADKQDDVPSGSTFSGDAKPLAGNKSRSGSISSI